MNRSELHKALPQHPVDLWLRLLGVEATATELDESVVTTLEVVGALYSYKLIPRVYEVSTTILDTVHDWSKKDTRVRSVAIINQHILILKTTNDHAGDNSCIVAVDTTTGDLLKIPNAASPIVTTVLHLPALREQTLTTLQNASKGEAGLKE